LNAQHQLGLDLDGNLGGQIFNQSKIGVVPNLANTGAAAVEASYANTGNLTNSDYELAATSTANVFTLRRLTDGKLTTIDTGGSASFTTAEIDGFTLTIPSGAAEGDSYLIRPTRDAAEFLSLQITDVRQFAAAAPLRVQPAGNHDTGGVNEGSAAITQPVITTTDNLPLLTPSVITLEWDPDAGGGVGSGGSAIPGFIVNGGPDYIEYDPLVDSAGKPVNFPTIGNMSFTISGVPENGDQFIIENNEGGVGDNRNALVMAGLQNENTLLGRTEGGVDATATFQETYGQLVSGVGSKTHQADINYQATHGLVERHKNALLSVSGVNLDEEAADMIRLQQAYQAAAQVINVAKTLFDTLISSVRG
jgi:flagellar hook-associated protein 1 FlgK